jgi:ankyrin repeat protein
MTINTEFDFIRDLIKNDNKNALVSKLDEGLNPNLSNKFGWTLLMIAVLHDRYEMANLLLSRGAEPKRVNHFGDTANSLVKVKNLRKSSA